MERGAYKIFEEIVIDRPVTIQGDALMLPMIDCKASERGFRIKVCPQLLVLMHGVPRPSSRPPPPNPQNGASWCFSLSVADTHNRMVATLPCDSCASTKGKV